TDLLRCRAILPLTREGGEGRGEGESPCCHWVVAWASRRCVSSRTGETPVPLLPGRRPALLFRDGPDGILAFPQSKPVRSPGRIRITAVITTIFADGV